MKIGELASRAGCDAQTVRFYEREGLLPEPPRQSSGYRQYADGHLARLGFIRHCRSLDIPLPEVRQLLALAETPSESCGQVNGLIDRHIELVRERVRALQSLETQLVSLRRACDGDASHPCTILQSFMGVAGEHACACHGAGALRA
ncbi:Cd(II)/Pb(II)-responsive transcriptional regulator [Ramlibacter humi]|uniref:Cd(II)/Pb(II)-responsive transcriptional regulator n=1 Tax=Ramlibacter humi TaxID=2530451 RepID=A0A4Z0BBW8_9BURK|nr:Cd(II)/Pb(II)-responsive transcriptional regulator [Ramlibacter humi]TFY96682.1 Cd(II)/Pb(II)-responsive transcriptional regulator [Ramlibacter humi]